MAERAVGKNRRVILAGAVGNLLEWYDFAIYGYFAPIVGAAFFPSDDPLTSLLAAFGAFAAGFIARPLGAIIFGHIGDRIGRKASLTVSIFVMGVATVGIGLLPDYETLGPLAAVMLVLLRMLQGIGVSGEYAGGIVFLAEHAPPERRGRMAAWPELGSDAGFLLGSAVGALTAAGIGEAGLKEWGWRVPFFIGGALALVGLLLRRSIPDVPLAEGATTGPLPIVSAFRHHWRSILRLAGMVLVYTTGIYIATVYAMSFLNERMHVSTARALDINTANMVVLVLVVPIAAWMSDRFGRKPMLYAVVAGYFFLSWPLWWLMHHTDSVAIFFGQFGLVVLCGTGLSVGTAAMSEMFPAAIRVTAIAVGYNVCVSIFGGSIPFFTTYLVARTADDFVPAYILMAMAMISFLSIRNLKEMKGQPLPR